MSAWGWSWWRLANRRWNDESWRWNKQETVEGRAGRFIVLIYILRFVLVCFLLFVFGLFSYSFPCSALFLTGVFTVGT